MKETREVISWLWLAFFFWTPTLHAAGPAWEYIYEGDILPDDTSLGNQAWQLQGDNRFAEITEQGELRINDVGVNHCFFLYNLTDAALMQDATVEARVKVLSQSGSANFEVLFGMQDGSNSKWLDLFPDHILLDSTNRTYNVDMTEYHVLRMVRNAGDIRIYVDNEPVLSGPHVGAGETWIGFIFGAGCTLCRSEQYWDYLVFTTEGGFAPDELPSYASLRETELAYDPLPADAAEDVVPDVSLSWTPGEFAAGHDVYMGTSLEDVNTAAPGTLVSQGQTDADYTPDSVLQFGQTYYWRVDEVNGAPDHTVFKGKIWSFTTEPYSYPISSVTALASSFQTGMGPENTINGSGLTGDRHGTEATTMWLSAGAQPNWIQYEFDKVYKLDELRVWNSNQLIESFLGFGARTVTVETSLDGATWTAVADVPEFSRAPGAPGYAANTTVSFGGVEAKYVKLTITATWGGVAPQAGLAEVRFFYVPVQARGPQPAVDAAGVAVDTSLNWRPGREATAHQVFFGTDAAALGAGHMVTDHSFIPGALDFGTKYYWKVDEVGAATYPGAVWSFTTQEYRAIDDFESYTDQPGEEVFSAWIDGVTTGLSGSTVGYFTASGGTFCERTIVHGGRQSMPLQYDNTAAPFFSEAEQTFDTAQNWTTNGADSLVVYFRGPGPASASQPAGNSAEGLYIVVTDTSGKTRVVQHADPAASNATSWQTWTIPLTEFTSAGVKMNAVKSLTLGVGNKAAPKAGGTGTVYLDDLGFGHPAR